MDLKRMDTADLISKAMAFGMVQVPEEISQLVDLVKKLRPRNVLEIGSESGGTFYLWCRLAAIRGLKISLDLPSGSSGSGRFTDKQVLAKRSAQFQCWAPNVRVLIADSHEQRAKCEIADILAGEKLDFLFIDGDHSREGVMLDWEDYRGFVRLGGLIAFHDIKDTEYHRSHGCFVSEFWRELQGEKIEFCSEGDWGGIGVVTV